MIEETENQEQSLEDLIEIVERDDLPTNIYTNETTDPMVLLGKINEVIGYLRTLQGTIESSDTKATQALASAIQALETANTALSSSTTALTNANQALSTANTAISSANIAVETANTASTTATEAKQTAEGIASTANQALSTAQNANATANSASAAATEAKETANSASTTAVNANITANNANSTAQQALTTAQGKQDALTETQLDAVNSGITSALVTQIGTNTTNITSLQNNKQDNLTTAQLNAVNSGITANKVTEFESKQDALSQTQLNAVNSGITSTKIGSYDENLAIVSSLSEQVQTLDTTVYGLTQNKADKSYVNRITDYSTSEVAIGKWIDGSTLYRKVFNYTTADTNQQWTGCINLSDLNIKAVVNIYGTISDGSNVNVLPVGEGQYYRNLRYNENTKWLEHINNSFNNAGGYIAIEYTKN